MKASADQPYVMAIVGSPRPNGNTSFAADVAIAELEKHGVRCEKIALSDYRILPCEGHDECEELSACPLDDDAGPILERMYAADGLIFATPVYYEDVSGQMKVFIDRNCFYNYHEIWLAARTVGLIAIAAETGVDETIDSLRRFVALSSNTWLKPLAATGLATKIGDAADNPALIRSVGEMAHEMVTALLRAVPAKGNQSA